MTAANHSISPAAVASSLTLVAEVFAQWQAGKVVVLDGSGITVDAKPWNLFTLAPSSDITQTINTFKFQDGRWIVGWDGKESHFKDSVGLQYLHLLLPRKPISVSQFVYLMNCPGSGQGLKNAHRHDFEEGGRLEGLNIQTESKDPLLKKDAHKAIRNQLPELKRELELLIAAGDIQQAEELEEKIHKIEDHLQKANYKGLDRPFSSQYKRDLDRVRIAVNRAIRSIGTVNPTLAWHLTCSIRTGALCVYRPEIPVQWDL